MKNAAVFSAAAARPERLNRHLPPGGGNPAVPVVFSDPRSIRVHEMPGFSGDAGEMIAFTTSGKLSP
jgi:hypothetical protein